MFVNCCLKVNCYRMKDKMIRKKDDDRNTDTHKKKVNYF